VIQRPLLIKVLERPTIFEVLSGSSAVLNRMLEKEIIVEPRSLKTGVESVRRYLQTCVDNSDTLEECASYGGHVHVATITEDDFIWQYPPRELTI
jgi:hypothetical protein